MQQASKTLAAKEEQRAPSPSLVPPTGVLRPTAEPFKPSSEADKAHNFVLSDPPVKDLLDKCDKFAALAKVQDRELDELDLRLKRMKAELEDTQDEYKHKSVMIRDTLSAQATLLRGLDMLEKSKTDKADALAVLERETEQQAAIRAATMAAVERIQQQTAELQLEQAAMLESLRSPEAIR